ncbi:leucine-rich repeat serine/threonine-protein kinase 1-like [Diadema antillarum]|uniref:leucine-rich repeat serine/threonine-protein kinase 1-like n=1 Tax=Diadema antillarum TaxID=105358 RepID=UPI003A8C01D9
MDVSNDKWHDVCKAILDILERHTDTVRAVYRFMQTMSEQDVQNHLFPLYCPYGFPVQEGKSVQMTVGAANSEAVSRPEELHRRYGFFHTACRRGDIPAAMVLICWGVDPLGKNLESKTGLEIATLHGHMSLVTKLMTSIEGCADDTEDLIRLLCCACESGQKEMVDYWLGHLRSKQDPLGQGMVVDALQDGHHPLVSACKGLHYSIAAYLIETRVVRLDEEVTKMLGGDMLPLLKTWVEQEEDTSKNNNNNETELVANWHHKQLNTFDPAWLRDFQDSSHQVLSTINLSQNSLFSVPEGLLWGMPNLRRLNLSQNALCRLPAPKSHRNLQEYRLASLSLYQNQLDSVPVEVFMLPALEFLSLARNCITDLIQHTKGTGGDDNTRIWRCISLGNLDLSQNSLSSLPTEIDACTALLTLNLSDNKFEEVPHPWACPLEVLNISKNKVQSAPPDLPKFWRRSLRFLNLSNNRLTEIPPSVCRLGSLSELDLSRNFLRSFPLPQAWDIRRLQHLNLSYNQLMHREVQKEQPTTRTDLPRSPVKKKRGSDPPLLDSKAPAPRTSNAFCTKIRGQAAKSPSKIIDAHSRSVFYATPPTVTDRGPMLWERIELPDSFAQSLYVLKLSHNELEDVPPSICKMETLYDLDLSSNPDLHHLPEALSTLKHLFHLKIDSLDITSPVEVSQLTPDERSRSGLVLRILREKLLDSQPYHSMKLTIMGPAKSGKTTLLNSLMKVKDTRLFDAGIHVTEWELADPLEETKTQSLTDKFMKNFLKDKEVVERPSITFFAWDMKGGDLYENVQQCFFTSKTLYLLVWNMTEGLEGAKKLSSLLLNISSRASDFGIIIIGTHSDSLQSSPLETVDLRSQLQEMLEMGPGFPPVAGIVEVDAMSSSSCGMTELRRIIFETALQIKIRHKRPTSTEPLIGRKVPLSYFNLKKRILKEVEVCRRSVPPLLPIMTATELAKIVQLIPHSFLDSPEDLQGAVDFLHEIGCIVHFTDHMSSLSDLYFIDPVWLAGTLQRVSMVSTNRMKDGKVHLDTLRELSRESDIHDNRFDQYLQLLARFEIVVPISQFWFLVPSRLPRDKPGIMSTKPASSTAPFHSLRRVYKMPYLPPGFWIRLVSRLMADLHMHDSRVKLSPRRLTSRRHHGHTVRKSVDRGIKFHDTVLSYWREGVSFRHRTGHILVRSAVFPPSEPSPGVDISISCQEGHFAAMGCVVDHIEGLIKDWYPGLCSSSCDTNVPRIQRLVPCPVCLSHGMDDVLCEAATETLPHCYTVEELVHRLVRGETQLPACANSQEKLIPIDMLIPDMFMKDLPVRHLREEDFELHMVSKHSLGQGGFGEVFKAKYLKETVAAKTTLSSRFLSSISFQSEGYGSGASSVSTLSLERNDSTSSHDNLYPDTEASMLMDSFHKLRSEVAIMSRLNHPCIVRLVGVSIQHLCFAMDFAPLGDLQSYLYSEQRNALPFFLKSKIALEPVLSRTLTHRIAQQVASAIRYLHGKDIIYCDLKTDNILLFSVDENADVNIKLTDYGISRTYDLMGAMGLAGPPGFCAPEILQGLVFDEKVDWFSYGMFLYHLLTGLCPYYDKHSRLEIQLAVNEGRKPAFHFQDYSMPPQQVFPAMGALMEACWQDHPGKRPHGRTIEYLLHEPSFLCLRRVVEVEDSEVTTAVSVGERDEENVIHLIAETGQGTSLRSFYVNEDGSYKSSCQNDLRCPIITTATSTPCGTNLIVGTMGDFVQLYHLPRSQSSYPSLLQECKVSAQPTSLLYLQQPTGQEDPILLVGQVNGMVTIFSHQKEETQNHEVDKLRLLARLQLTKHVLPTTSLVEVVTKRRGRSVSRLRGQFESSVPGMGSDTEEKEVTEGHRSIDETNGQPNGERSECNRREGHRQEIWVGCGPTICIISLPSLSLEPDVIRVAAGVDGSVEKLVLGHGSIWCSTSSAHHIYQYDVETRHCMAILDVREKIISPRALLTLEAEERQELRKSWEEKEKAQELAHATAVCEANSNRDGRFITKGEKEFQEELSIVDDHFKASILASPSQTTLSMQRSKNTRRNRRNIQSIVYSHPCAKSQGVQMTSLLAVDRLLWVGRSSGDILLVNIENGAGTPSDASRFDFGEVVTVLNSSSMVNKDFGKVRELHRVGRDRVVACHSAEGSMGQTGQIGHLLLWANWAQEQVVEYQGTKDRLRHSSKDQTAGMA